MHIAQVFHFITMYLIVRKNVNLAEILWQAYIFLKFFLAKNNDEDFFR